jgi:predicted RNase H-like nuclease
VTWVAGVDACRGGWFAILRDSASMSACHRGPFTHISEILELSQKPRILAVDIPIGLLSEARHGGRECDRLAREMLGHPRSSSVFSPPVRAAISHKEYEDALAENRGSSLERVGISRQCFGLFAKIRHVDEWIDPYKQERVREVHPELCFFELNRQRSMRHGKKSEEGLRARRTVLAKEGFGGVIELAINGLPRQEVARDDILDACAACWTAERILGGKAFRIPENPPVDGKGLRMEMWR